MYTGPLCAIVIPNSHHAWAHCFDKHDFASIHYRSHFSENHYAECITIFRQQFFCNGLLWKMRCVLQTTWALGMSGVRRGTRANECNAGMRRGTRAHGMSGVRRGTRAHGMSGEKKANTRTRNLRRNCCISFTGRSTAAFLGRKLPPTAAFFSVSTDSLNRSSCGVRFFASNHKPFWSIVTAVASNDCCKS